MKARPRAIIISDRVTMKAGTRNQVTIRPLKAPNNTLTPTPNRQQARMASGPALAPPVPIRIDTAVTTAARASKLPTDKSIPAVMITIVMPIAMIATGAFWLITFSRFCRVKKLGQG